MKLGSEAELVKRIQRHDLAAQAVVDQAVGSVVFGGGKKAGASWKKLLKELRE